LRERYFAVIPIVDRATRSGGQAGPGHLSHLAYYSTFGARVCADLGVSLLALGAHEDAERALERGQRAHDRAVAVTARTIAADSTPHRDEISEPMDRES
jgi:hypothetical protein